MRAKISNSFSVVIELLTLVLGFFSGTIAYPSSFSLRHLSSIKLPNLEATRNEREILKNYPAYLDFVLEIGNTVDRKSALRLRQIYTVLKKEYPTSAARFLRGLRYEIIHRLDFISKSGTQITTENPDMRRWVQKFIKLWLYEADEQLFRARSIALKE